MKTIYLDTNIFLNVLLEEKEFVESSFQLLSDIEIGKFKTITSFITLMEIHRILQKNGKDEAIIEKVIKTISTSSIEIDLPDGIDMFNAYELLKKYKLDPIDALHVNTAVEQGAIFVSRDNVLIKKVKSIIKTAIPEEINLNKIQ